MGKTCKNTVMLLQYGTWGHVILASLDGSTTLHCRVRNFQQSEKLNSTLNWEVFGFLEPSKNMTVNSVYLDTCICPSQMRDPFTFALLCLFGGIW